MEMRGSDKRGGGSEKGERVRDGEGGAEGREGGGVREEERRRDRRRKKKTTKTVKQLSHIVNPSHTEVGEASEQGSSD